MTDDQLRDLLRRVRALAMSCYPFPDDQRVGNPNLPVALGTIAGLASKAAEGARPPGFGVYAWEGKIESTAQDGGQAKIAEINDAGPLFVRLQSWDETREHAAFAEFEGKRVRITIEVV